MRSNITGYMFLNTATAVLACCELKTARIKTAKPDTTAQAPRYTSSTFGRMVKRTCLVMHNKLETLKKFMIKM